MKKKLLSFLILPLFWACNNSQKKQIDTNIKPKSELSIKVKHSSLKQLNNGLDKEIEDWKEYQSLKIFLTRFEHISPNEALSNALELKDLAKKIKDSIRPEILKTPAFKARVNVFENESLRLADMTYIPAITAKEINYQIDKIFLLYENMIEKINLIYTKKQYEEEVSEDEKKIKLDSSIRKPTPSFTKKNAKKRTKKKYQQLKQILNDKKKKL